MIEEVDGSPWRLEEVDGGDEQYPVESRFVVRHTPPDEQDPRFDRSAPTQVRFVRFAVCHTPTDQQDPRFDRRRSVSYILRYATPLPMNTSIPLPPHEHDDDAISPFRPSHVHEPWPYVCTSRCSRPCPYVRTWPYFLSCTLAAVCTCICYVCASTMTRASLYIDQYVRTHSRPE